MKKNIIIFLFSGLAFGQIGINTNTPDKSSILDIKSNINTNNKGLLIPRVSLNGTTDTTTINSPAEGLLVFNLNNGNNNTPIDSSDDVEEGNFYFFSSGKWNKIINENNLNQSISNVLLNRIVLLAGMKSSGNDLSFVSNDLGNNIRKFFFDSIISDKLNTFNTSTGEFTAPFTGYYLVTMNILLKPWSNNYIEPSTKTPLRIGLADPFTGSFISSGASDSIFYNSNEVLDSALGANFITYLTYKKIIYMTAGQKTIPLVKYITPGSGQREYNLNTESNNYNRTLTNNISIIFTPTL